MADYAEELLDSISILVNKRIESVKFDETIKAVVTDASNAKNGEYTVSTGHAKFTAYSTETSYRVDDAVMVTVPQGDYDNQKIIVGKAVDKANTPMIYLSPFLTIIDVTNNLIVKTNQGTTGDFADRNINEIGYYANSSDVKLGLPWSIDKSDFVDASVYTDPNSKPLWDSGVISQQGFTRLGLRAQFSTWLSEYNTVRGNYGLALEITFKALDAGKENNTFTKIVTFDSDDFFGNVYFFETYYTQEIVFDITDYLNYPITRLRLFGYQRCNFLDAEGNLIESYNDSNSEVFGTIPPNIFIKDPYICFGLDAATFSQDTATLLCDSSVEYQKTITGSREEYIENLKAQYEAALEELKKAAKLENSYDEELQRLEQEYEQKLRELLNLANEYLGRAETNKKTIKLRWVHEDKEKNIIKTVEPNEIPAGYHIWWYRYKLGAPSPDRFAGAHWVRFYGSKDISNPSTTDPTDYNRTGNEEDIASDTLLIDFIPGVNNQTEQIKAIILYKEKEGTENTVPLYRLIAASNILELINNDDIPSLITITEANALAIKYDDNERGNYLIYNRSGRLNEKNALLRRSLTAVFDPVITAIYGTNAKQPLTDATSITWTFPSGNTMIIPTDETGGLLSNPVITGQTTVYYKIRSSLSRSATDNIVRLAVEKDGLSYFAQALMVFGIAGTSGSPYTLLLTWDDGKNALNLSKQDNKLEEEELVGTVSLLDLDGNSFAIPNDSKIIPSWKVAEYTVGSSFTPAKGPKVKESVNHYYPVVATANKIPDTVHGQSVYTDYCFNETGPLRDVDYFTYQYDPGENNFGKFIKCENLTSFDPGVVYYRHARANEALNIHKIEFVPDDLANSKTYLSGGNTYKLFVLSNNMYVLDPMTSFNEALTYYIPVETEDTEPAAAEEISGVINVAYAEATHKITITPNKSLSPNSLFILQLTLTDFGDYDLVAYYPIPIKANLTWTTIGDKKLSTFVVDYVDVPTNVRYGANGEIDFYKNPFFISTRKFTLSGNAYVSTTYLHGLDISGSDLKGHWELFCPSGGDPNTSLRNFVPTLEEKRTPAPTAGYDVPLLLPLSVYIPNAPNYGLIFKDKDLKILWCLPVLVYEDNYPSTTLNQWDGKDILTDNDAGTIVASGFAAGKKERDNTFTGVVLGDWSRSDADRAITKLTGVFGFNHGSMSYAWKDDGTGFIGKDGKGRIHFDGNKSLIYSSNWIIHQNGMFMDVDDGVLKLQQLNKTLSLSDSYSLIPIRSANAIYAYAYHNDNVYHNEFCYTPYYEPKESGEAYLPKVYYEWVVLTNNNTNEIISQLYVLCNKTAQEILLDPTIILYKKINGYKEITTNLCDTNLNYSKERIWNNGQSNFYIRLTNAGTTDEDHYITLGANLPTYPLSIGTDLMPDSRKFKVAWDGSAYLTDAHLDNAYVSGHVDAQDGTLGTLEVLGTLYGGEINGSTIKGGHIYGSDIRGVTNLLGEFAIVPASKINSNYKGYGLFGLKHDALVPTESDEENYLQDPGAYLENINYTNLISNMANFKLGIIPEVGFFGPQYYIWNYETDYADKWIGLIGLRATSDGNHVFSISDIYSGGLSGNPPSSVSDGIVIEHATRFRASAKYIYINDSPLNSSEQLAEIKISPLSSGAKKYISLLISGRDDDTGTKVNNTFIQIFSDGKINIEGAELNVSADTLTGIYARFA